MGVALRLDLGSNLGLVLASELDLDLGLGFELGFSKGATIYIIVVVKARLRLTR